MKPFYLDYISNHIRREFPRHLITKIKEAPKEPAYEPIQQATAQKMALLETVNNELKNICNNEHKRHHPTDDNTSNLVARLIEYNLLPCKTINEYRHY